MRVKKRTIAAVLSLAMMLGLAPAGIPQAGTPFSVTAQAAKKKVVKKKAKKKVVKKKSKKAYKENPKLSRQRVSLRNKKTATIKVSKTKKGISVASSDKSIATVTKSGKFAFRIKAAKKKKGIAVIRVKTSRGYRYVFVQVGGRTNMSSKTRTWAQAGGFIQVAQPSTPQAQKPETVPAAPVQPQQPVQPSNPQPQQPAVAQPQTQPQTQAQTIAPETQPQTTSETKAPETQPQTTPETNAPETQPNTSSDNEEETYTTWWNDAGLASSEIEEAKVYDSKVAELCGVNNPSLSKWQKLYNFVKWFSYTYQYKTIGDFNSYYPLTWKNYTQEYPGKKGAYGYNCGSGAGVVLAWAQKYLGCPKGHGHSAIVNANNYNGHVYARVEIDGEFYIAEPYNYKNEEHREFLKNNDWGFVKKDPLTTDSPYHPNNLGY